jgi:hypothetical protein
MERQMMLGEDVDGDNLSLEEPSQVNEEESSSEDLETLPVGKELIGKQVFVYFDGKPMSGEVKNYVQKTVSSLKTTKLKMISNGMK